MLTITGPMVLDAKEVDGRIVYSDIRSGTAIARVQVK
jgi:hypothetical protein